MGNKARIEDIRPVAVYNADTKKLIGIFRYQWIVVRYLFTNYSRQQTAHISNALKIKSRILKSDLKAKIAVRFAKQDQVSMMGGQDYFMQDESLKKFDQRILNKFEFMP